jgi:predicted transposase/invertase (TIGR01784 family)
MKRQFVSFDWALKKLLRSKANFVILEGFLSELLCEDIKILDVLDSETNKNHARDKSNRVDLLVKNQKEELIIVEVQYEYEADYMQRILYGTSKIIVENIVQGMGYGNVKKVISVSIVYFDLGQGEDYVYQGTTKFIGLHKHDVLKLSDSQRELYGTDEVHKIYPEYYILKVNQFNDVAKNGLDEWIYFLKNDDVKKGSTAKGLKEAAEELNIMKMPVEERKAFDRYCEDLMYQASMFESSYVIGENKGRREGKLEMARKMKAQGIAADVISAVSGFTAEEISAL